MALPKIEGIFTPNMVPLDDSGAINEAELERYLDWLIRSGVHGLYPNGSTGEFTRFTAEERRRIIEIACRVAKGRVPVLAGAAEANVKETLRACETYAGYGARAVAVISPIFYKLGQESIYAYFKELAVHSPIDVTVYNIPMLSSPIEVDTIVRLAEFERIVGIKDSTGDVAAMSRMIYRVRSLRPEFVFFTGWDSVLVPMLVAGVNGGTNASSGVVPEVTRKLYDAFKMNKLESAMAIQYPLIDLFEQMLRGADFPEGFRAGVELRGFNMGTARQPVSQRQTLDRAVLKQKLECLLADFSAVPRPAHCPVQSVESLAEKIARDVVLSLKRA